MNHHGTLEIFGLSSYHNSVGESEEQSRVYEQVAKAQDDKILGLISTGGTWSADDIKDRKGFKDMLLTSIRRALTNLSKGGYIELCGKKMGKHGRNVLVWRIIRKRESITKH